jgi:hypothetical protein
MKNCWKNIFENHNFFKRFLILYIYIYSTGTVDVNYNSRSTVQNSGTGRRRRSKGGGPPGVAVMAGWEDDLKPVVETAVEVAA